MTAVHLGRLFLKEWADIGILNELFYWKSSKGNEVDFIIFLDDKPFGIEVKYQNIVSKWDEMSIRKGIGRGMVITRDVFEYGEIPKIPLWAFLLLDMK
jgi:predicted AAA+ superfamily ATPase